MTPSAPLRRGTSPKYDRKIKLANPTIHIVFGGGRRGLAVEVDLVRAANEVRLRQAVLRSAFEGLTKNIVKEEKWIQKDQT